ncbi:MAG: LysM peptidoglycan-binding domain-containing protein [Verrucomicrobiae bacterium]|nr:LysM peptidoglycan-binding domain-containing protein [Verrucomicrobiae bacterium]
MLTIVAIFALSISPVMTQAGKNHETYIVKPGDTLWQLARSRGCSVEEVKKLNRLNSDLIRPNQKLIFPKPRVVTITQKPAPVAPAGKTVKVINSIPSPAPKFSKANPSLYSLPLKKSFASPTKVPRTHTTQTPSEPLLTSPSSPTQINPRSISLDPPPYIAQNLPLRSASANRSQIQLNPQESKFQIAEEPTFDYNEVFNDEISLTPTTLITHKKDHPQQIQATSSKTDDSTPISITKKLTHSPKHNHSSKFRSPLIFSHTTPPPTTSSSKPNSKNTVSTIPPLTRLHTRVPGRATEQFRNEIRRIASQGIKYKGRWRPPGESVPWVMDCSNTTRWLYQRVAGVDIGRTASDQFLSLRNRGRIWIVPKDASGNPSRDFLEKNLRPGDLLFWEHTYRPVRWPPITHVAIYLGKDEKGRYLMAASNSSGTSTRRGGPNIYVFRPEMNFGGYRPIGSSRYRHGRFVAIGRPVDNLDRQTFAHQTEEMRDLLQ